MSRGKRKQGRKGGKWMDNTLCNDSETHLQSEDDCSTSVLGTLRNIE